VDSRGETQMTILGNLLEVAVLRNEFRLYYQPKIDLVSRKIEGVEALIRWDHPEKGILSPLEFLPYAEDTGLIIPIGEWVIQKACNQMKVWMEAGFPPLTMAVNLSARQLNESNLVEKIKYLLMAKNISPKYLELEIKESMIMNNSQVIRTLRELKRIGVRISLADVTTGFSSLNHMKEIPIDVIKIDRSLVKNCVVDVKAATIVKEIIARAHQLNIKVSAEGIESREHLMFLQQNRCDNGQGYLFSKPLPQEEFVRKFNEIEQNIVKFDLIKEKTRDKWIEKELEITPQELLDTIRQHEGMIFKFKEKKGRFIHTLCDGDLMYRMGYTSEQIVGKELYDFLPDPVSKEKIQYYQRAWAGEEHVLYERKDKGIWYLATLRPIRIGGQVVEVIASCVDITEQKISEEERREAEKLSVVERLAVGVAHEIRNPLTSLMGFTQLLKKEAENPFYFNLIFSDIRRLEKIVNEFLTFAQPQETHMEEMDANTLLQEALILFHSQTQLNNVQIIENPCENLPPIYCDANQIKQVLIKILQNAVDALPNGGIIKISTMLSGEKFMAFRVVDQGCGISDERMKHIGEPFYSTKEKGIGLGLMICKKIMKAHGGSIHITSKEVKGTTVDILVPTIQSIKSIDELGQTEM
jgi:EAL domain-containing protein (putative c-di-GMP-specific phosphodiesterase class I)/signal transduction histidine kinase